MKRIKIKTFNNNNNKVIIHFKNKIIGMKLCQIESEIIMVIFYYYT